MWPELPQHLDGMACGPGYDYNENWGQDENFERFRNQAHLRNSIVFNRTSKHNRMQTDRLSTVQGQEGALRRMLFSEVQVEQV